MSPILNPDKKYTFSDYFDLNYPTEEIVAVFDYHYLFSQLNLPKSKLPVKKLNRLRQTYITKLPFISLTSETAKREFYIAPLLFELLDYVKAKIDVEYPLNAGKNLSGTLDYLIKFSQNLLIIEAKKGDLEKGFNQLCIELIALDKITETAQPFIYGAVTLGDVWRFGVLDRENKLIKKDMNVYTLLTDLEVILSIFIGVLEDSEST